MVEQDTGRAPERSALAWQRTATSVLASAAALTRVTWTTLGGYAVLALGCAALLAALVLLDGRVRYRARSTTARRGGRTSAALTLSVVLLGLTEIAAVAIRAM